GPPADPTAADARQSAWETVRAQLVSSTSPVWIFFALVIIVAFFGIDKPHAFLASFNIRTMFINASVALTLSVGMTYVIITSGIDLSVGSVLVMSGVIALKAMMARAGGATAAGNAGWGIILLGVAAGLAVGLGWGLINGILI